MPHPAKVHRGGEDAVFLSDDGLTFGELNMHNLQADDWEGRSIQVPGRIDKGS